MSSDDRFREMFYEEARELLIGLEEGLMDLERRQSDRAHLDRTFRAAHSLKGAAAMVGLAAIAEFTHGIEAVLDRIRGGTLAVDSDIITTLLEARDHLAMMVEAEAVKSPIPPSGELTQRLACSCGARARGSGAASSGRRGAGAAARHRGPPTRRRGAGGNPRPRVAPGRRRTLRGEAAPSASKRPSRSRVTSQRRRKHRKQAKRKRAPRKTKKMAAAQRRGPPGSSSRPAEGELPVYQITLVPGPDVLRRGVNPLGVLDELRELGETTITTDPDLVPPLEQLDPERCYLSWTIQVKTAASPERISEAFLFFAEDSALSISRLAAMASWFRCGRRLSRRWRPVVGTADRVRETGACELAGSGCGTRLGPQAARPGSRAAGRWRAGPASRPAGRGVPTVAAAAQGALAAPSPSLPRLHARIRVDAGPARRPGRAGRRAGGGHRQPAGLARDPRRGALDARARGARAGEPGGQGHDARPADGAGRRAVFAVSAGGPRPGRPVGEGDRAADRRPGHAARPHDRGAALRPDDPSDPQRGRSCARAARGAGGRKGSRGWGGSRFRPGTRGTGWRSGSRMTAGASTARRSFERASSLGMVPTGTPADDPRVVSLIFEPGFSTRDTVSELSGRGVGLDVVRDAVRALRGSVAVESTPGKGTAFIFRLPLTLALIDGLLVEAGGGKICGSDGAGRGMRRARPDGDGLVARAALRFGARRAGSDGLADGTCFAPTGHRRSGRSCC